MAYVNEMHLGAFVLMLVDFSNSTDQNLKILPQRIKAVVKAKDNLTWYKQGVACKVATVLLYVHVPARMAP